MHKLYFDDPEVGLSPETSHPNFRRVATEDFYYDCCDDFSPFGNDDGSDALHMLEEWFQNGGSSGSVETFLRNTISGWGFGAPKNLSHMSEEEIELWLSEGRMHERYLQIELRLRIAVAFGELKICGQIDEPIVREAKLGFRLMMFLNKRSEREYPNWTYRDHDSARLQMMEKALISSQT